MSADAWANVLQTAALVIAAGALGYAARQAKLARHGGGGANVLAMWSFLQNDKARANRRVLYLTLGTKGAYDATANNWSDEEVEAARHVCSVLSVVGALAKADIVPLELLVDEWGPTIARCWSIAKPIVVLDRTSRWDETLWANFEWLADQCGRRRS